MLMVVVACLQLTPIANMHQNEKVRHELLGAAILPSAVTMNLQHHCHETYNRLWMPGCQVGATAAHSGGNRWSLGHFLTGWLVMVV